jgi:hypothetical protein
MHIQQTFIAAVITLVLSISAASARNVDLSTVPKRNTVELTIYKSEDLTLVRETRSLTFKKGVNPLQFSWGQYSAPRPCPTALFASSATTAAAAFPTSQPRA